MDCEKCGASVPQDAETCPECSEPVAAAAPADEAADFFAEKPAAADADTADAATSADAPSDAAPQTEAPEGGRKPLLIIVAAVVVLALVGGGVWFAMSRVASASSPQAAAKAMLEAYAAYDAKGILAVATHDTMKDTDIAQFEKQAAEAKKTAKDQPSLKNISIGAVSEDATDKVTVDVTAEWLDPATGKYAKRTEKLVLVKRDGKWLVELF